MTITTKKVDQRLYALQSSFYATERRAPYGY